MLQTIHGLQRYTLSIYPSQSEEFPPIPSSDHSTDFGQKFPPYRVPSSINMKFLFFLAFVEIPEGVDRHREFLNPI